MNPARRQSIVVLISGRGSNMRALVERSREPGSAYEVRLVLADQPTAAGLGLAVEMGIAHGAIQRGPAPQRAEFEQSLAAAIDAAEPSLLALAGFMRILSAEFVGRYAGRMLNIHPSLLPKYPGLHTHQRALAAGDAMHGATVHFVTPQLDAGPAVLQAQVPVLPDDDEATLATRVQQAEHVIYPLAVDWHARGRLQYRGGQAWLDGAVLDAPVQYGADAAARCG